MRAVRAPRTTWRIFYAPDSDEEINVRLSAETEEPAIVEAIEQGARYFGLGLERTGASIRSLVEGE